LRVLAEVGLRVVFLGVALRAPGLLLVAIISLLSTRIRN
jgi:hypothetical protein